MGRNRRKLQALNVLNAESVGMEHVNPKKRYVSTGMPKAGPVKVIAPDGTFEIIPPFKGGSTDNIGIFKNK